MNQNTAHFRGYTLHKQQYLEEVQSTLTELIHDKTGARIIHLTSEDAENTFAMGFRTPPASSNGIAHILEHTVLCGSKNYPVKDPFFSMIRRSLNTFMNAMTGQDYTCYPASSMVKKDFYNLLAVYLDAVFYPKLDKRSFKQEGHRLSFTTPEDPTSPLIYKGIVYNEMKGAMSSPGSRLSQAMNAALFPDTTYGYNSGGEPSVIPDLTYDELIKFHKKYYTPSRCIFFFHGNLPLQEHLGFLEKKCLHNAPSLPPLPPVAKQQKLPHPVHTEKPYPFPPSEDTTDAHIFSVGWVTCSILEQETLLALDVLETALLCTDASPLRKALLQTNLCQSVGSYLDDSIAQAPLIIQMKGCKSGAKKDLFAAVDSILEQLYTNGIPKEDIESALHQLELDRLEILGDGYPWGLHLFHRTAIPALHGTPAEKGLLVQSLFTNLRNEWKKNPRLFEDLIKKYLLDNTHKAEIHLFPDTELEEKELQKEREHLDTKQAQLSEKEKEAIVTQSQELALFQQQQEEQDIHCLPKVTLQDVSKNGHHYPLTQKKINQTTIYHHDCFTNGLVYFDWTAKLSHLTEQQLCPAKLLLLLLPNLGFQGTPWQQALALQQQHTAGIGAAINLSPHADNPLHYTSSVQIGSKGLSRKSQHIGNLVCHYINHPDLSDKKRIRELILRHHTGLQTGLAQRAVRYAVIESAAHLGPQQSLTHEMEGLPYLHWVKDLAENIDERIDPLLQTLQELHPKIFHADTTELIIGASENDFSKQVQNGIQELCNHKKNPLTPWQLHIEPPELIPEGRMIAAPVAFCTMTLRCTGFSDPVSAHLTAACNLMEDKVLHSRIREQGGAYGSHATYNPLSGIFTFYTFRDPNISSSYKALFEAVNMISEGNFSDSELEEAKLQVIQTLDSPAAPGSRANIAFSWEKDGRTWEKRQAFRQELLKTTREQVIEAVSLQIKDQVHLGIPVIFSGKELLFKEIEAMKDLGFPELAILST